MLVAGLLLSGCADDDLGPVLQTGEASALTGPDDGSSYVLTEATAGDLFPAFEWTATDFGFDAAVEYTLEMDVAGNDFADPVTLGVVNALTFQTTNGDINEKLFVTKALPPGQPSDLAFRVKAEVSDDVEPVYSSVITLTITPYEIIIVYPQLQVPGSYQGWDPANETTVIYSIRSDGNYDGYIFFDSDNTEYKFTQGVSWDVNWGDTGADGTLNAGGDNILAETAGVYRLNVNLNALTYTSLSTEWGLIGDATGSWDEDKDMIYDPGTGVWSITLDLVAGEMKFRANDDWAVNLGDTDANLSLEYDGDNIAVAEPGSYTVELLLHQPVYSYTVTKN